jgi:glycosyltransferase involved in cell wall biosynthesis
MKGIKRLALVLLWYKLPVKRCAAVTVVSEFTKSEVLHFVKCTPERITVIPDPVSPQFVPNPLPFNVARPVILQVGTGRNKNIPRVAEALRGLHCHLACAASPHRQSETYVVTLGPEVCLPLNPLRYTNVGII